MAFHGEFGVPFQSFITENDPCLRKTVLQRQHILKTIERQKQRVWGRHGHLVKRKKKIVVKRELLFQQLRNNPSTFAPAGKSQDFPKVGGVDQKKEDPFPAQETSSQ